MFSKKSYPAQLKELYSYKRLGIRPALEPIRKVLKTLGDPHKKCLFFHVAGTNGKGSTTGAISNILIESGYKTGSFFSPHVSDYRERIQINGKFISKKEVLETLHEMGDIYSKARKNNKRLPEKITFFEWTTALAFYYFAKQGVEIAVMETGMGGRLDATNIIKPLASVITNISLEHKKFLGKTLAEIAGEKAGIIKRGIPIISGVKNKNAKMAIAKMARMKNAPVLFLNDDFKVRVGKLYSKLLKEPLNLSPAMPGKFQKENSALAVMATIVAKGVEVLSESIESGITKNSLPGRFERQTLNGKQIIFDVAHNPPAIKELVKNLGAKFPASKFNIIFGTLRGKNYKKNLSLLKPITKKMTVISPDAFRSLSAKEITDHAVSIGIDAGEDENGKKVKTFIKSKVPLLVTGSFTVVESAKRSMSIYFK